MTHTRSGMRYFRFGASLLILLPLASLMTTGCKGVLQDYRETMSDYYTRPDAIDVVKNSPSGDRQAKFIRSLREPLKNGGDQAGQDEAVGLLAERATSSPYPIVRSAAIKQLGRYEDPRAAKVLQDAYYRANSFAPFQNNLIKQQALRSLGETGSPDARQMLIRVVRADAKQQDSYDQQQTLDERMAAIRALSKFQQADAAEALVHILRNERDKALRIRAHQSLQDMTGKRLPPDPDQWQQVIYPSSQGGNVTPASGSYTGPVRQAINWWWGR